MDLWAKLDRKYAFQMSFLTKLVFIGLAFVNKHCTNDVLSIHNYLILIMT